MKNLVGTYLVLTALSAYAAAASGIKPATFEIPYLPEAPQIDGEIVEEEWEGASAITGGVWPAGGMLTTRQFVYWFGWDENNLYLAARTFFPPGTAPAFAIGAFNFQDRTDSLELAFFPDAAEPKRLFRVWIGYEEFFKCPTYPWEGLDAELAGRVIPDPQSTYGDGTLVWEIEARFPKENFNIGRPIRPGDRLDMLLTRNFRTPWEQSHLPVADGFFEPEGFVRGRFTRNEPSVQFRDVLPLLSGRAGVTLHFFNPTEETEVFVKELVIRNLRTGQISYESQREFELAPGDRLRHTADNGLPGDVFAELAVVERARVDLTVKSRRRQEELLAYRADYRLDPDLVDLADIRMFAFFPDMQRQTEISDGFYAVLGAEDRPLGYIVYGPPPEEDIIGHAGPVPFMAVLDSQLRIKSVHMLDHDETPRYAEMVSEGLKDAWTGLTVQQAAQADIDAVTRATRTSNALIRGVRKTMQMIAEMEINPHIKP